MAARKAIPVSSLSRPLPAGKTVSGSAFAFLFAELLSYHRSKSASIPDLETRLQNAGYTIGVRFLELLSLKERPGKRDLSVVPMLQFISSTFWTNLFGKTADALEKSTETANAYMIREDEPLTNYFISMPKDYSRLNCACFIAGIIHGALDTAGFSCTVSAITVPAPDAARDKTVFVIKFDELTSARET